MSSVSVKVQNEGVHVYTYIMVWNFVRSPLLKAITQRNWTLWTYFTDAKSPIVRLREALAMCRAFTQHLDISILFLIHLRLYYLSSEGDCQSLLRSVPLHTFLICTWLSVHFISTFVFANSFPDLSSSALLQDYSPLQTSLPNCLSLQLMQVPIRWPIVLINSDTVSVLCRERLWVVVDLKKRNRNSLNELMNDSLQSPSEHQSTHCLFISYIPYGST